MRFLLLRNHLVVPQLFFFAILACRDVVVVVVGASSSSSSSSSAPLPSTPPTRTATTIARGGAGNDDDDENDKEKQRQVVIGVDGGTESIRACCFDAGSGEIVGRAFAVPYRTSHPEPGWAEQDPDDWYENLGVAVRHAVNSISVGNHDVLAICVDTTCCSVVALDREYRPLRPCLLWMDQRSGASQTKFIMDECKGDPALAVNCGGHGPISAEWMTPKALWICQNEPEIWNKAATICEYQDYINYKLTGTMVASACNAASRWHWDGSQCCNDDVNEKDRSSKYPGRPLSLYKKLGIPDLADKLPSRCVPMGTVIGELTEEAAEHLGLQPGLSVVQGGPDAFVGMVGLGCVHPGRLCLITGSSHLHCVVSSTPQTAPGVWGAYKGAPLTGINFAEGGQSSTGSIIRWARNLFGAHNVDYRHLDVEAGAIVPGSDGLVALETFQGSRTPITDPRARGALIGLTLSHTRAHVWRALMEAVCFGTRACVDALADAGHNCDEIVIAGGATRSDLWLQMHADVSGRPVIVCENTDAPLLGCAILASFGVGVHPSVDKAVESMVRIEKRIEPNAETARIYNALYHNVYSKVAEAIRPVVHAIQEQKHKSNSNTLRGGGQTSIEEEDDTDSPAKETSASANITKSVEISPSLLACDWARMRDEVHRCLASGASRLHVDIFDGVFLDSPLALTFGPQMVDAIRRSCESFYHGTGKTSSLRHATLDLHMCVDRPERYISPMAEAGADRFIFQWEAMDSVESAMELAVEIFNAGLGCGVSINPETDIEDLFPLLATTLVEVVDVLAVEPGFGGQAFQPRVLEKIRILREWRQEYMVDFDIMVDGGVNYKTFDRCIDAGADILVSGSYLFDHPDGMEKGIRAIQKSRGRLELDEE